VIGIDKKKIGTIALTAIIIVTGLWSGYTIIHALTPVRVGVLLQLTGDIENREAVEWAADTINRHGGIGGRPLELVYKDTGTGDTLQLAEELLADDSVGIVIGPPTSDDVYALAPAFAAKKKILISPYATSGDLSRAFGSTGHFWRTAQGDVAQADVIIAVLKSGGAQRIALLTENTSYGKTFYDWTGFFALESGLNLTSIGRFERGSSSLDALVDRALRQDPDYLIAICGPADAAAIKRAIDRNGSRTKLFLADSAAAPPLISSLGTAAEGIEGTTPTADPTSGFSVAYRQKFGHPPADFAAAAYDAVLLAAYTAARQDAAVFESPADSVRHVVYGNGTRKGWDAQEVHEAIAGIRRGESPYITGASGSLDYDREYGAEPLATYYSHWIVEDNAFRVVSVISSKKPGTDIRKGVPATRSHASADLMSLPGATAKYSPPRERRDFRAVIAGPSRGWSNYRHQSDALAVYTLLRDGGVADDHIILMIYDDVPFLPENPLRGDVHNVPRGKNLRAGAGADYTGRSVTAENLKNVLTGNKTETTPLVLESDTGTDVFVYIASHGAPGDIVFSGDSAPFTTEDFSETAARMSREGKYRQIVFFVDTCFGGSIAVNTTAKGLLYVTGAAATEPSLGAVYDTDIRQWLSDEFTATALNAVKDHPDITFRELYIATYGRVHGSHVQMVNAENFGNLDVPVREFVRP
jgi:ABC-type branched-subunit amino acid transport system substrate-binding protein